MVVRCKARQIVNEFILMEAKILRDLSKKCSSKFTTGLR